MKIEYATDPNYREMFVNGAAGGVIASGDIFCQFFSERGSDPTSFTMEIRPGVDLNAMPVSGETPHVQRTFVAGVFIPRATAKALGEWLLNTVKAGDALIEAAKVSTQ